LRDFLTNYERGQRYKEAINYNCYKVNNRIRKSILKDKITRIHFGKTKLDGDLGHHITTVDPKCKFCHETIDHQYFLECGRHKDERDEVIKRLKVSNIITGNSPSVLNLLKNSHENEQTVCSIILLSVRDAIPRKYKTAGRFYLN